jgi:hypothetical protein
VIPAWRSGAKLPSSDRVTLRHHRDIGRETVAV